MGQKKIVIAVGGTGGHLFPAQRFAESLIDTEILFAGHGLGTNPYFDKTKFSFLEVDSVTPFKKKGGYRIKVAYSLLQGIWQSVKLLFRNKPELVVGFGSFHAFPLLAAAFLLRIPIALFESNAIPGKVIRLFSFCSVFTAIYMQEAKKHLKGNVVAVHIPTPLSLEKQSMSKEEARLSLGLLPHLKTLLVFGGSQGAQKINEALFQMIPLLKKENLSFQLIHLTGSEMMAKASQELCQASAIPCYSVPFEKEMDRVWRAADLTICRSGAMTVAEILHYEVAPILIPYPFASEKHQEKNAQWLVKDVQGAIYLTEEKMEAALLAEHVMSLLADGQERVSIVQEAIRSWKQREEGRPHLAALVTGLLQTS